MMNATKPFRSPAGWLLAASLLCTLGCHRDHVQSALHPAGPAAAEIAMLWWAMFGVLAMVFLGTMLLLGVAMFRRPRLAKGQQPTTQPPLGDVRFVTVTGIVVPSIILVGLLVISLRSTISLRNPSADVTIEITGHQFWWHVEYPGQGVITANEFYIPAGEPVELKLRSADVIHSLWVPNLTGKIDMIPERVNTFWIQADEPGRWRGQCAEFCGTQHARMGLWIIALPREEFDRWVAANQQDPPPPSTAMQQRGHEVFFSELAGCDACHAIRGTDASARLGPDLTHLASRRTLGAATLPNRPDLLKAWIADSHQFKPGNLMPPTQLPDEDLEALVQYLLSLE